MSASDESRVRFPVTEFFGIAQFWDMVWRKHTLLHQVFICLVCVRLAQHAVHMQV